MAEHFGCNTARSEQCAFTWRIEKFSMHAARKNMITSPVFESKILRTQWYLRLIFYPSAGKDAFDVILVRGKDKAEDQFLNVRLSVIDRFRLPHSRMDSEIVLDKNTQIKKLCSIRLEGLMSSFCGLNKLCLLPKDSLTLRCEMTVSEDGSAATYKSKDEFESHLNSNNDQLDEFWTKAFLPIFLLCSLTVTLFVVGFLSVTGLIVTSLLLFVYCYYLRLLELVFPVLWDLLLLYLERLVSNYVPTKGKAD